MVSDGNKRQEVQMKDIEKSFALVRYKLAALSGRRKTGCGMVLKNCEGSFDWS